MCVTGRRFDADRLGNGQEDSALGYSDGTQTSRPEAPTQTPPFSGLVGNLPTYPDFLQQDSNPAYSDDERDADNDGLNNVIEEHERMRKATWDAWLGGAACGLEIKPWAEQDGAYFGAFDQRSFVEPEMLRADTDGDSLLDAEDDQDHDRVPNFGNSASHAPEGSRAGRTPPCTLTTPARRTRTRPRPPARATSRSRVS